MRIAAPWILSAALTVVSLSCNQVSAATLAVHTQAPKVDVHLPPPKVNVPSSAPKVQTSSSHVTNHDLNVTKTLDKSSPKFLYHGKHIPSAHITARRNDGSSTAYDKKSDDKPSESMSLEFNKIEVTPK
jgi:type VI protein secretion system component Hcp